MPSKITPSVKLHKALERSFYQNLPFYRGLKIVLILPSYTARDSPLSSACLSHHSSVSIYEKNVSLCFVAY